MSDLPIPHDREEVILNAIATGHAINCPEPHSRKEIYLKEIYENGGGSGGSGMTPEQVESIIEANTDLSLSDISTNPVSNKAVTKTFECYVAKVEGKGLSSNDYSDSEKQKVDDNSSNILMLRSESGHTINVTLDKSTYMMTVSLLNKAGEVLNEKTVDFPMETAFVNASYDKASKTMKFTLESGSTVDVPLGDLVEGLVSQTDFNVLSGEVQTLKTEVESNTNAISEINDNLDNLSYGETAGVKNLFKIDTTNWTLTDNGIKNNAKNDGYFLGKIKLFAGKTYKISFLLKSKPTVDSSFTAYIDGSVYSACTFAHFNSYALNVKVENDYTATSDCELLYRLWGNSNSDIFEFQLQVEEGTVATDYKPYIPSVKMLADDISHINDSLSALGKCKNLLKTTLGSGNGNGITYINNGDGTYTLNGTCTNTFELHFNPALKLPYGKYKLLGTSAFQKDNNGAWKATLSSGNVFEVSESKPVLDVLAYISSDSVVNKTFKPMVTTNLNATENDFVPYTGDGDTLTEDVAKVKNDMTWKLVAKVTKTSTDDVISVLPDTWKEVMVDIEDTTTSSTDDCYARSVFTIYRECVTYNGNNYFRTGYSNLVVNITGNHSIKIPEMNSGTAITIYYRN